MGSTTSDFMVIKGWSRKKQHLNYLVPNINIITTQMTKSKPIQSNVSRILKAIS